MIEINLEVRVTLDAELRAVAVHGVVWIEPFGGLEFVGYAVVVRIESRGTMRYRQIVDARHAALTVSIDFLRIDELAGPPLDGVNHATIHRIAPQGCTDVVEESGIHSVGRQYASAHDMEKGWRRAFGHQLVPLAEV